MDMKGGGGTHGGSSSEGRCLSCAVLRMESEESQHASFCCVMPMYLTEVTERDGQTRSSWALWFH